MIEEIVKDTRQLDQNEVDQLLGFSNQAQVDNQSKSAIRAIIDSHIVSYERLPMLDVIFARFIRLFTHSLHILTNANAEISLESITSMRFGKYYNSIKLPAILSVVDAKELNNQIIVICDAKLIYKSIDLLLGGRQNEAIINIEGRPQTAIERKLAEQIINTLLSDLTKAFKPLTELHFLIESMEMTPRFIKICSDSHIIVLIRIRIDLDDVSGMVDIAIPYATIEPIRNILVQMFMGEKFGHDTIWSEHFAEKLCDTDIFAEAVIDEMEINLQEILKWKINQTIVLNAKPDGVIKIRCGGVNILNGKIGRIGQTIAVKIDNKIIKEEKK